MSQLCSIGYGLETLTQFQNTAEVLVILYELPLVSLTSIQGIKIIGKSD